ncbi:MAG: methionine adenosyltransferase [Rickettsiales bacterium]|nr:methionine adenosyltransferase [Rickettsiales bacterium]
MNKYLFTSESVSHGHPDKVCDQISDMILDLYLSQDSNAKVAAEAVAAYNKVFISGEIGSKVTIPDNVIEQEIRNLIRKIGYVEGSFGADNVEIEIRLNKQSEDINIGVDKAKKENQGAGDQGIMFGFASNNSENYMPASISYAHRVLKRVFGDNKLNLGPDAKSQITIEYVNDKPVHLHTVLLSIQHKNEVSLSDIAAECKPLITSIFPDKLISDKTRFLFNPTGRFVIGGPEGDVGLTGRKIIVDTYGGYATHGGGAFSGKDPSKVDRSATYMARYLAKNIVAAGLAGQCLIQLSYAIGMAKPISVFVNFYGTGKIAEHKVVEYIKENINLTPYGIITTLDLRRPIYQQTATYGHFGRNPEEHPDFTWERLDLVDGFTGLLG